MRRRNVLLLGTLTLVFSTASHTHRELYLNTREQAINFFTSADFIQVHWETSPVVLRTGKQFLSEHGQIATSADIFEGDGYVLNGGPVKGIKVYEGAFYNKLHNHEHLEATVVSGKFIQNMVKEGNTIAFGDSQRWNPGILDMVKWLSTALRKRTNANIYLCGSALEVGMDAHNDQHDFVVVQLSGKKRWKLWKVEQMFRPVAGPKSAFGVAKETKIDTNALGKPLLDIVLEPGNMLYVPRGLVHLTSTPNGEQSASLHVTIAIALDAFGLPWLLGAGPDTYHTGVPQFDFFPTMFQKSLAELTVSSSDMRRAINWTDDGGKAWIDEIRNAAHQVVDHMFDKTATSDIIDQKMRHLLNVGRKETQHRWGTYTSPGEEIISVASGVLRRAVLSGSHPKFNLYTPKAPLRHRPPPGLAKSDFVLVQAQDNGLFANLLNVFDALLFSSPRAMVRVAWLPTQKNGHFTYGRDVEEDRPRNVWDELFQPLRTASPFSKAASPTSTEIQVDRRINPLLTAPNRGLYFRSAAVFSTHREIYNKVAAKRLQIRDEYVLSAMSENRKVFAKVREVGGRVFGLHLRRLSPAVVRASSLNPGNARACAAAFLRHLGEKDKVYVATDDAEAVVELKGKLADYLLLRAGVSRVSPTVHGQDAEVHVLGASINDAKDAVIDAWLLSETDQLWHNTDSNIVIFAAFLNPILPLHHISACESEDSCPA